MHALASARDERRVEPDRLVKSIGHEETFATDLHEPAPLQREIVRLSDSVGSRLRAAGMVGRTVTLKVRFGDFTTITRSRSLPGPLLSASEIARASKSLLEAVDVSPGVRLIGVSVSSLEPREANAGHQLELIAVGSEHTVAAAPHSGEVAKGEVDSAVGAIRRRYGAGAVGPATVVGPKGLRVKRPGDAQWGPGVPDHSPSGDRG